MKVKKSTCPECGSKKARDLDMFIDCRSCGKYFFDKTKFKIAMFVFLMSELPQDADLRDGVSLALEISKKDIQLGGGTC